MLAACALTIGVLAVFAERNVFDADGFAERTEQTLQSDAVSAELARRLTDAAIRAEPDLVGVRPLVTSAAEGVVRSAAFRSLVRAAARDVHRSVFDRDASTVTLTSSTRACCSTRRSATCARTSPGGSRPTCTCGSRARRSGRRRRRSTPPSACGCSR